MNNDANDQAARIPSGKLKDDASHSGAAVRVCGSNRQVVQWGRSASYGWVVPTREQ